MTKKIVNVSMHEESIYDLLDQKTPDELIALMTRYKSDYEGRDIYFSVDSYGYDGGVNIELWERRLETESEYRGRMAVEARDAERQRKAKQDKDQRDRKEYERLKKKFG